MATRRTKPSDRAVALSLGHELDCLHRAVDGVRLLVEHARHDLVVEETAVAELRAAVAVAELLAARLGLLRRVVVGAMDAATLLADHNRANRRPGDDPDVVLRSPS